MATIKDIARRLNISTSTVSYALNDGPRKVPEAVRLQVLEVARELDYRPNRVARSLVTRMSSTIGIVPPTTARNVFLSPFVSMVWNALVNEAETFNQDLLLFTARNQNSADELGMELLDGRIDGVVFIAPLPDSPAPSFLAERNFPFASISSSEGTPGAKFNTDNTIGVKKLMQHLVSLGHHRIAHISGDPHVADGLLRTKAYLESVEEFDLFRHPDYLQIGAFTMSSGMDAANRLLENAPIPTAIVTANDEMAFGVCQTLQAKGFSIPDDISVAGFDDIDLSRSFTPPLTTVRQPATEMSAAALRAVVNLVRGNMPVESHSFEPTLIIRESTGSPRDRF